MYVALDGKLRGMDAAHLNGARCIARVWCAANVAMGTLIMNCPALEQMDLDHVDDLRAIYIGPKLWDQFVCSVGGRTRGQLQEKLIN